VREVIDREAARALERRHRDIVIGFYKQFPESARETLKHIQELVPYPLSATKAALARKLHERYQQDYPTPKAADKAITIAWALSRERALMINGTPMTLMTLRRQKMYSGNLRPILKQLRPDRSSHEIETVEKRILSKIFDTFE